MSEETFVGCHQEKNFPSRLYVSTGIASPQPTYATIIFDVNVIYSVPEMFHVRARYVRGHNNAIATAITTAFAYKKLYRPWVRLFLTM